EEEISNHLSIAKTFPTVKEVRVLGAIGVIEMKKEVNMKWIQEKFVEEGIWVRPFGKMVYIMPPYIISKEDLENLCLSLIKVVSQID
ncbi:MAG: aminotransferase class III-fold pyridoxal phosphate-dependent enzyme, partial [Bacteroidales bacterium]|nr:aminotransferase class III-fold pyridoxal phosphate-dependent enzyme [Bacteroidales bacterium]